MSISAISNNYATQKNYTKAHVQSNSLGTNKNNSNKINSKEAALTSFKGGGCAAACLLFMLAILAFTTEELLNGMAITKLLIAAPAH